MPIPNNVRNRIDNRFNDIVTRLQSFQDSYFQQRGRYWQGIRTRTSGAVKPTDQQESWQDVGIDPVNADVELRVDIFDGPDGAGYSLTATGTIGGETWTRTVIFGPGASDTGWVQIHPTSTL